MFGPFDWVGYGLPVPPKKVKKSKGDYNESAAGSMTLRRVNCIHEALTEKNGIWFNEKGDERKHSCQTLAKYVTENLDDKASISERTIRRDIQFMKKELKLPIQYDARLFGYSYTKAVDKLPWVKANEGDLFGLFIFQQSLEAYKGTPLYTQLSETMDKLTASLNDDVEVSMGDLSNAVSHRQTNIPDINVKLLKNITSAITKCHTIDIAYQKPTANKPEWRRIDPYHAANVDGSWYLYGYDHKRKDVRVFHIQRIKDGKKVKGAAGMIRGFERPANFNVSKYIDFGVMAGDEVIDVEVRFTKEVGTFITERKWHHSQRTKDLQNGGVKFEVQVTDTTELRNWILGWGSRAKVIKPKELKREVAEIGRAIMENNS